LDDGRLTDSHGRTVDFSNTVIIMTSNLGSDFLLADPFTNGQLTSETKEKVMTKLRKTFRPELLNRLDDIIIFTPLNKSNLSNIVNLATARIQKRLQDKHVSLKLDQNAIDFIIREAWNPIYGARPLNRLVFFVVIIVRF
jgi:ATP-dependent Clp protease ATP-binding subunit ClpB